MTRPWPSICSILQSFAVSNDRFFAHVAAHSSMTSTAPVRVSVIVPVYNNPQDLQECENISQRDELTLKFQKLCQMEYKICLSFHKMGAYDVHTCYKIEYL